MGLIAVTTGIGAATVCDEYKVAFEQIYRSFLSVFDVFYLFSRLLFAVDVEYHVFDVYTVFDFYAAFFQIFLKGLNKAFVLIIFGETQSRKIGQSVDMVNVPLQIPLHFERRIPRMEREHRLPVKPEVAVPEIIVEIIADFLVFEFFFGRHEQFAYLHRRFFVKSEFVVGMRVFAAIDGRSAKRIVGVGFVEPVIFVENRTNIRFDIDEMRIKLNDKKVSKATNAQMIELTPAMVLDQSKTFKYGYRNVLVLKKMTFPNDKVLTIEISEKQISGRTISLDIDYEDVLYADSFNSYLMMEE